MSVVEVGDDARAGRREPRTCPRGTRRSGGRAARRPTKRYGMDANAAAMSQRQRRRRGSPRARRAGPRTRREPLEPEARTPLVTDAGHDERPAPARRSQSATAIGKQRREAEVLRERPDEVRDGADVDREAAAGGPIRATPCVNSERLDDPGSVRCLGEDDHAVARLRGRRRRAGRSPCRCARSRR